MTTQSKKNNTRWRTALLAACAITSASAGAQTPERARDLGIPFNGTPGALNAITDVRGVEVGYTTRIEGEGKLVVGKGPIRTGVTVVFPRGKDDPAPVYGGWFSQNGNGEMTGTTWLDESGFLEGPIAITNTHSVGVVRDSVIAWSVEQGRLAVQPWMLPVVAETWDGGINDINGFHISKQDVFAALNAAKGGAVAEGNVGGGTGMICYEFKGGSGTSSRVLPARQGGYTVGVFVQCNCGDRSDLTIAGVPVGKALPTQQKRPGFETDGEAGDVGSIIIVVATDAPLLPVQLKRLAKRATMGLARTGSTSGNYSGDIFIAFSTANHGADGKPGPNAVQTLSNDRISPLFQATVEATEEAIVNAMVGARSMKAIDGSTVEALPHDKVRALMQGQR
ncbi:MAG TPA: P1 family peptidase [Povalibacter sp.]|nr:P1 family peptidase [Povalibacter sp.]